MLVRRGTDSAELLQPLPQLNRQTLGRLNHLDRNNMTPKTTITIALRLLGVYSLFLALVSLQAALFHTIYREDVDSSSFIVFQLYQTVTYCLIAFLVFKTTGPIARKLSSDLPQGESQSRFTHSDILSMLIAAASVIVFGLGIEPLINDAMTFYQFRIRELYSMQEMFNRTVSGLVGTVLQMVVATIVFLNAKRIASWWTQRNFGGGLTSG